MPKNPSDFLIANHGTIILVTPVTLDATKWVNKHLAEDRLMYGAAIVVEPRYISNLVKGIQKSSLSVEWSL